MRESILQMGNKALKKFNSSVLLLKTQEAFLFQVQINGEGHYKNERALKQKIKEGGSHTG